MTLRTSKIIILSLLFLAVVSCQKKEDVEPLDYSVQVIPDIATVLHDHYDLISTMNELGQLHFGDTPPQLSKLIADTTGQQQDTLLGFCGDHLKSEKYIPSDPNNPYTQGMFVNISKNQFLFFDQHKGISSLYFRSPKLDSGPDMHFIEKATCHDSIFIMGTDSLFTAYYFQDLKRDIVNMPNSNPDLIVKQAVILSGKVTDNGIKDLYFGIKVYGYSNTLNFTPGTSGFNIGDIVVYYKDFMPFTYWDPNQYNSD